jgi:hypothetical protein
MEADTLAHSRTYREQPIEPQTVGHPTERCRTDRTDRRIHMEILNCSSEEAFAEIRKILAVERLKLRANEGETILHHIDK